MSDTTVQQVPGGFLPMPSGLGFTDNLQPSYRRIQGDSVSFGRRRQRRQCRPRRAGG
jgi:hypothetical protein